MYTSPLLKRTLTKMPSCALSLYAGLAAFAVYFCMYAFRKPFTAANFSGITFLSVDYKVWLVTAQVIGYMLSKFYGIRFIAAMRSDRRAITIIKLILFAWLSLLLFALIPAPYNIIFLLLNGFPLGMVWGLVFSFLEGRRATEFMGALLATSFIFSSGVVKTLGKSLLTNSHVSETGMPFIAGALFVLPMVLFTWLLNHLPAPSGKDIAMRTIRMPMTKQERKTFLATFLPGIVVIVTTYVLLTILRDFRDNFANELYTELGYGNDPSIFTTTEIPVSLAVLCCMSLLVLIKNNYKAFLVNHLIIISGYIFVLISTSLFAAHHITPISWMVMTGTGLYLSYVPFNALYFERMIATYKVKSNIGFIMYIADAFGYLGSVLILFLKNFSSIKISWTSFFIDAALIISIIGIAGTMVAAFYFSKKYATYNSSSNIKTIYG